MVKVHTSEVDLKPTPVSLGLSRVKFGNDCWATQEFIIKQWVSLLESIDQKWDPRMPIVAQQWYLRTTQQQLLEDNVERHECITVVWDHSARLA
jgi:hypothetical protein